MGLPDDTLNGKGKFPVEGGGRGSPTTLESTGLKVPPGGDSETKTAEESGNDTPEHARSAPVPKGYENHKWKWDERIQDYVCEETDGRIIRYTLFQKSKGNLLESVSLSRAPTSDTAISARHPRSPTDDGGSSKDWTHLSRRDSETSTFSGIVAHFPLTLEDIPPPPPKALPPAPRKKPWEFDLDPKDFQIVEKRKRFFTVGRIFKTIWFEPHESAIPARQADLEWGKSGPAFYGSRPVAKFRWFVVVRKRLNHSLCFSITTYGGPGTLNTRRGRAVDFVVLHSSDVKPPKPDEEEQITREPIALILEGENQFISPHARLDCSRIYTVEDGLKVMKIGRVHPDSLGLLNDYFTEAVL